MPHSFPTRRSADLLKAGAEMARLFDGYPEAVARTLEIAERCRFSLDELRYEYPEEPTEDGRSPQAELAHRVAEGARRFYPAGVPDSVEAQIRHELAPIAGKDYTRYFLNVHDIHRFAAEKGKTGKASGWEIGRHSGAIPVGAGTFTKKK